MNTHKGNLRKMSTEDGAPITYRLKMGEEVTLNELIGKKISLRFTGTINCVSCGVVTKKSFGQGFCYPCFQSSPDNAECIIRPELCQAHEGKGRDPEWEERNHNQPHVVYLAVSSQPKVGVTRETQVPTRWIDQGASRAIRLAYVPYRQLAGQIEVELKDFISDKTSWQKMLKNEVDEETDLLDLKEEMLENLPEELAEFYDEDDTVFEFNYPVNEYPAKVKSLNFDKEPLIEETLVGIKGQYLLFEGGKVINIRKFSGYEVELSW